MNNINRKTAISMRKNSIKGATMIEYVLLAALIAVVVAALLPALTTAIGNELTAIETAL